MRLAYTAADAQGRTVSSRWIVPAESRLADAQPWYGTIWFWLALCLLSVVPFLASPLPPLGDLFEHMGRYHVMLDAGRSEWLHRYYRYRWLPLPNLGQDLLMVPMGRLFGVERGALILSASILPASILAIRSLSLAVHGRVQPLAILALPFLSDFTYLYGFMNYHTGLVVTLWALVVWHWSQSWTFAARTATLTLLAFAAWFSHLAAWAVLLIGIGCLEIARLPLRDWRQSRAVFVRAATLLAAMALPILINVYNALTVATNTYPPDTETFAAKMRIKLSLVFYVLRDEHRLFDIASLGLVMLAVVGLLVLRQLRFERGVLLFAAILFALFIITPTALAGGYYADVRILPVAYIMLLVAGRMTSGARTAGLVALAVLAFVSLRVALTTIGWVERGQSLNLELAALDHVPRGARIASAAPMRTCQSWPNNSLNHLPGMAIVRRDAFVNTAWNIPGQQPMQPIPPMGTPIEDPPLLAFPPCHGVDLAQWLGTLPRSDFDFVWLFRVTAPAATRTWLKPVYRGPQGTLYAIDRHLT